MCLYRKTTLNPEPKPELSYAPANLRKFVRKSLESKAHDTLKPRVAHSCHSYAGLTWRIRGSWGFVSNGLGFRVSIGDYGPGY